MTVQELIDHLTGYANQSPENWTAEVRLKLHDDMCYELAGGDDLRGVPGEVYLVLRPNVNGSRFGVREFRRQ